MAENPDPGLALLRRGANFASGAPNASQDARWPARWRFLILVPLTLFMVWEVITRSLTAYLAHASPEVAIRLRSNNPSALVKLAQDRLGRALASKTIEPASLLPRDGSIRLSTATKSMQGAKEKDIVLTPSAASPSIDGLAVAADLQAVALIRALADRALVEDPLNAHALRILGQVSGGSSDSVAALMRAAVRRSLHESAAVNWMMRKSYQDGDYSAAVRNADILLRTRPSGVWEAVMPVLGRIADAPDASGVLKQLLASNPSWRSDFFSQLPGSISDARTPLDILLSVKDTPTPPAASDLSQFLKFLIEHKLYDLAYYTWLQFLSPEQLSRAGHLFNGSFELTPSGLPFDWTFRDSGVIVDIVDRTDGKGARALFMEFGVGRVDDFGVTQMIVLAPGDYQFRGQYKADIVSQRGLQWRVTCASNAASLIGQSPTVIGAESDWKDFKFAFTVPETDCPAQAVQLAFTARSASEQFISGSAWFDDLQIGKR